MFYIIINKYKNKRRINVEDDDDLIHIYREKNKKRQNEKLLLNDNYDSDNAKL